MKAEPIQITLLPGGERNLRQNRGLRLGKTGQLLVKYRVNEWLRSGVVRLGSEGRGPLRVSPAFVAPKKEKVLGEKVFYLTKLNLQGRMSVPVILDPCCTLPVSRM